MPKTTKCQNCGHSEKVHFCGQCCVSRYQSCDKPACECPGYKAPAP
jgi:hypothetical protein